MREVVFTLEFRGHAGPVPGTEARRRARSTASSQVFRTLLGPRSIEAGVEPAPGDIAVLESEVEPTGDATFVEWGTIRYGAFGTVTFRTAGQGVLGPPGVAGVRRGAVIWEVTTGERGLSGAVGFITSNFIVTPDGQVTDNHVARLFLAAPDRIA